jgi:hypothetical protein
MLPVKIALREAEVHLGLHHHHIVQCYDIIADE